MFTFFYYIMWFKDYSRKEGFRDKNYVIYNNSSYLWGIHQSSLIKLIRVFLSYEKLKIVRIFGSRVTDEYKEFSDIDLIFEGTYSGKEYLKMRDRICKLEIPYVLDIYDINIGNKPFTYRNVVRSNLLYSRKDYYSEDSYISIIEKDDS